MLNEKCNSYLFNISADLHSYLHICNQIESNIVYLVWLFNIFKPLVITLFITLFLLPLTIVVLIYASSMYMFLVKHWNNLKVSSILDFNLKYL